MRWLRRPVNCDREFQLEARWRGWSPRALTRRRPLVVYAVTGIRGEWDVVLSGNHRENCPTEGQGYALTTAVTTAVAT